MKCADCGLDKPDVRIFPDLPWVPESEKWLTCADCAFIRFVKIKAENEAMKELGMERDEGIGLS